MSTGRKRPQKGQISGIWRIGPRNDQLRGRPVAWWARPARTGVNSLGEQSMVAVESSCASQEGLLVDGGQPVVVDVRDEVMLITLNRPEARNAVNLAVSSAVGQALYDANLDATVRAVVITGSGSTFCAGADLRALADGQPVMPTDGPASAWGFAGYVAHTIDKPTIAAVNGPALGGGVEIVIASDMAIAADTAHFSLPEVRRGLFAGGGGPFRLPRQIPEKVAMEMLFTGDQLSAHRAHGLGLVNHVVDQGDVLSAALDLAARIARNAPLAVQASKRLARGIIDGAVLDEAGSWARSDSEARDIFATWDVSEGLRAFKERREPRWEAR